MSYDRYPQRDVYSGDLQTASGPIALVCAIFEVRTETDPGALTRVTATLAFTNVTPLRVCCERGLPSEMLIIAVLDGVSMVSADLVLRKLQQLTVVIDATLRCEEMPRRVVAPSSAGA